MIIIIVCSGEHCTHVLFARLKKTEKDYLMSNGNYPLGNFVWDQVETESRYNESDPLEQMIEKEDMKQLSKSLFSLSHNELVTVMMMYYDDDDVCDISDVRNYFKNLRGQRPSAYKVKGYERRGLNKLRRNLRFKYGWER